MRMAQFVVLGQTFCLTRHAREFEEQDTVVVVAGEHSLVFSRGPKVDMGVFASDGAYAAAR
jgi:hypothetical protein